MATVTAGATGTVQFYIDSALFDTETLNASTATSASIATLATGTHVVSAIYSGDNNFPGNSGLLQGGQVVSAASVTVGIASSGSPSSWDQPVTFTATISSDTGLVKGRKAARKGAKPMDVTGSVVWSDNTGCGTTTVSYAPGTGTATATCTVSSLPVGNNDTITAAYQGDSNHATGTGTFTQVVNQASTTTALVSSSNPSTYQQNVTFTATIASANGGSATGTVTFYNGASQIGTGTVNNNTASLTLSTLPIGSDSITATYGGDSNYLGSTSSAVNQVVNKIGTATAVNLSPSTSTFSQVVTFLARIAPANGGNATGTVMFYNGASPIGTATVGSNVASLSTSTLPTGVLPAGTDAITAVYSGDTTYAGSTSPAVNETVSRVTTKTTVVPGQPQITYGQSAQIDGVINPNLNGFASTGDAVTGTLTFYNGSNVIDTTTVNNNGGVFTTTALPAGTDSLTAVYSGDTNNLGSMSAAVNVVVSQATTTTTLSVSPTQAYVGGDVTFTATVAPQYAGTPTGTVFFYDGKTRYTAQLIGGVATYTTSSLKAGSHSITAVYSSDNNFKSSTSSAVSVTVTGDTATTISVVPSWTQLGSPSSPTLYVGQNVTFTATVSTGTSGLTPDGAVTFEDGGSVLGTVALSGNTAAYTTNTLAAGTHHIVALYISSSGEFKSSTKTLAQKVTLLPTQINLTASPSGQTVVLTADVTSTIPGTGLPNDGTVTFYDVYDRTTTELQTANVSGGQAQYTAQLAVGRHTIKAEYSGDADFAKTSTTLGVVVQ
jgi:hypothetical protein